MAHRKFPYYAVKNGRTPGIYKTWDECSQQVTGYPQARFKGFRTLKEAKAFLKTDLPTAADTSPAESTSVPANPVVIYTDGGCIHNPGGRGGYGVVLIHNNQRKELSGGFRRTTNNRMELTAAIVGLSALKRRCEVTLYTDSRYVFNGITKGWAKRWRARDWVKWDNQVAANPDLWAQLLDLCDRHVVTFEWVRGHNGTAENERCDELATQARERGELAVDEKYEKSILSSSS